MNEIELATNERHFVTAPVMSPICLKFYTSYKTGIIKNIIPDNSNRYLCLKHKLVHNYTC